MRIAVVTTSYPSHDGDPPGHFVESEVRALERSGHDVCVVRPPVGGAFGWPGVATRLREQPLRAFEAAAWVARARREVARIAPARVIAHWCIPCAAPIAMGGSWELEVVSHGGDVRLLTQLPARARIIARVVERASRWRFVSEGLLAALVASLPAELGTRVRGLAEIAPSLLEIPDIGAALRDAQAKRSTLGTNRRLYVCAGRLVPSKRVDKVIDYVASTIPRGNQVLVVLGDGPERPRLERVAKAWQMDVRFLGKTSRREALGWIGAADELVHASRAEGLSTVIREAESLGVPVTILA